MKADHKPRLVSAFAFVLVACGGLTGCTSHWLSNPQSSGPRSSAQDVEVVRIGEELNGPYTVIDPFRVVAPSVEQGTETAKRLCAATGGEIFLLMREPYESRGGWNLVGLCSFADATVTASLERE